MLRKYMPLITRMTLPSANWIGCRDNQMNSMLTKKINIQFETLSLLCRWMCQHSNALSKWGKIWFYRSIFLSERNCSWIAIFLNFAFALCECHTTENPQNGITSQANPIRQVMYHWSKPKWIVSLAQLFISGASRRELVPTTYDAVC